MAILALWCRPNIINYNTLDTEVMSKAKGVEDAGDLAIEVARIFDDPGQIAILRCCGNQVQLRDQGRIRRAPTPSWSNTIMYAAGPGFRSPASRAAALDDFIRESYTVAFTDQRPIFVAPVETP
ncbi:hypothetical protein F2981_16730 [Sinorhizobium meliloti]|nr:hypothetical protein [Sinorhizobium meliloti]